MSEQTPATAAAPDPQPVATPHIAAAAIPDKPELRPAGFSADNLPPPGVPMEVHIDMTHPDLEFTRTRDDLNYTYEFYNEQTNTGPHLARTMLWRGADFKADRAKFLLSHPHIRIDWTTVKAFPNIVVAHEYLEQRRKQLYLKDPARIGAEEMFPDAPNRILEAGKPDDGLAV